MGLNRFEMRAEPEFRAGVASGIDAIRELYNLSCKDREKLFGFETMEGVISNYNSTEIMAKTNEYFNNLPRVGDYLVSEDSKLAWYVLDTTHRDEESGYVTVLNSKGNVKKIYSSVFGAMKILDRDDGIAFKSVVATLSKLQSDAKEGRLGF